MKNKDAKRLAYLEKKNYNFNKKEFDELPLYGYYLIKRRR